MNYVCKNNLYNMEQSTNSSFKSKKIFGTIVGVIAFGLTYFAVQQLFFQPPTFDEQMVKVASELNKTCPMMVDSETRLDNAISLPENVFQYNYTLINLTKTQVDTTDLKAYLEPVILNNIRTNPDLKMFRDNKVTMAYQYFDKNSEHLVKMSFAANQYQ